MLFPISNNTLLILFFFISFLLSYTIIPIIVEISNKKKLFASVNERSSHVQQTPNLGGISIFFGIIISVLAFSHFTNMEPNFLFLISLIILFFLGLQDDLLVLTPKVKLLGQIAAISMVVVFSDFKLNNFYGLFGIGLLDFYTSNLLTVFFFIVIINSFNLIDGIDGLAGLVGLLFSLVSGIVFWFRGEYEFAIVSFTLLGSLAAFLYFNFSKKNKIFMGDTGSMLVGFIMAFLALKMLQTKETLFLSINTNILVFALFFYPILDTVRIFIVRYFIMNCSPFKADKNHIHHKYLHFGFKHWKISLFVLTQTLFLVLCSFLLSGLNVNIQFTILLLLGLSTSLLPFLNFKLNKLLQFYDLFY